VLVEHAAALGQGQCGSRRTVDPDLERDEALPLEGAS
jgi:hypothetical protein